MERLSYVEKKVKEELSRQGLSDQVLWSESEFLFVGYYVVVIVLREGAMVDSVRDALQVTKQALTIEGIYLDAQVRAKWTFESVGLVQPLYASDGGLRAASVIPVYLRSGSAEKTAHVIITWAADKAIREMVPHANLGQAAAELVQDRLMQVGSSAWDPLQESTIEVNAAAAPYVSQLLRKAA